MALTKVKGSILSGQLYKRPEVTETTHTYTKPQLGKVVQTDSLSIDLSLANYFHCTPKATGRLSFSNNTVGQAGNILLENAGHTISASGFILINGNQLSTLSAIGSFWLSYFCFNDRLIGVTVSPLLSSGGQ